MRLIIRLVLVALAAAPALAAFPGANGKLAFESDRQAGFDIWTMENDGSSPAPLAPFVGAVDRSAAWSPDGTQVAFQSNRTGDLEIWVVNADGSNLRRLTFNPGGDLQPSWSPDGTQIAFARYDASVGAYDIWVMSSEDGSGARNVTNHWANDIHPAWSPDGTKIAFESDRDFDSEIYVQPADSSDPGDAANLTGRWDAQDTDPSWSPDGTRITFASDRGDGASRIYTMYADGTIQEELAGTQPGDHDPAWSPDGTKIAFSRLQGTGAEEIQVVDLQLESAVQLTATGTTNRGPDWQPLPAQEENRPPVANAGPDGEAGCAGPEGAVVHLDGSASTDPDSTPGTNDDIVVYEWFEGFGGGDQRLLGTGASIDVSLAAGTHVVTLRVTDAAGASATDTASWTVSDPQPASLEVRVSPSVLWPPNHQMVEVRADVRAQGGACSPAPSFALESVVSSEPDDAPGDGDGSTTGDVSGVDAGTPDTAFDLRAERGGGEAGRVYTITYVVVDGPSAGTRATAQVVVPASSSDAGSQGDKSKSKSAGRR